MGCMEKGHWFHSGLYDMNYCRLKGMNIVGASALVLADVCYNSSINQDNNL